MKKREEEEGYLAKGWRLVAKAGDWTSYNQVRQAEGLTSARAHELEGDRPGQCEQRPNGGFGFWCHTKERMRGGKNRERDRALVGDFSCMREIGPGFRKSKSDWRKGLPRIYALGMKAFSIALQSLTLP
ncbi:hypothetical protein MA16_Dca003633 [Dendrobium catenatum]|uniref:Uncharacterized protein n=1 Tax=Dendrobium catenatum TaxID=906689 RepID=A0A2I0WFJ6_9ASPA|nr:hypothetical protein MA16_Dca003633 [Dendrobium catenatum]